MREKLPRITSATALDNMRLNVRFESGTETQGKSS